MERMVWLARMPPPRRRTFLLASRPDGAPRRGSMSTATSRILATAHLATALLAFRPEETSAHRHPPAERTISAEGRDAPSTIAGPPASPGGMTGSADGRHAPSTIAMDVGPVADGHGTTEDNIGNANASLPDANVSPAGQSTRLYLLFKGSSAGSGRQIALVGRDGQLNG